MPKYKRGSILQDDMGEYYLYVSPVKGTKTSNVLTLTQQGDISELTIIDTGKLRLPTTIPNSLTTKYLIK